MTMEPINTLVVALGALVAGAINAVAGGGTVFSFTALVWTGMPLVRANATNATALVPGSIGGVIALRHHLWPQWRTLLILLVPTFIGSLAGAFTVANTSESIFRAIVPFLVLSATLIFAARERIMRMLKREAATPTTRISPLGYVIGIAIQFAISFYGGYFGAGIGILMLTALNVIGMHDLIKMNALKNALAIAINGTASVFFMLANKVEWNYALLGAVCSLIGGYVLGRQALRMNQRNLRVGVVIAGLVVSAYMLARLIWT